MEYYTFSQVRTWRNLWIYENGKLTLRFKKNSAIKELGYVEACVYVYRNEVQCLVSECWFYRYVHMAVHRILKEGSNRIAQNLEALRSVVTVISNFPPLQNCEKISFRCFNHPVCANVLQLPQETNKKDIQGQTGIEKFAKGYQLKYSPGTGR